jgi:hypothetical protein
MFGSKNDKKPGVVRVANLDDLIGRDQLVQLHGKDYVLKVPEFLVWLEVASAQSELLALQAKSNVSVNELIDAYFKFIVKICPDMKREDIAKASQQQVAALWQICMDIMNGYSKKKTHLSLLLLNLTEAETNKMIQILNQLRSTPPEL